MTKRAILAPAMAATMGLSGVAATDVARADGIINGMNPFNLIFGRDHSSPAIDASAHIGIGSAHCVFPALATVWLQL